MYCVFCKQEPITTSHCKDSKIHCGNFEFKQRLFSKYDQVIEGFGLLRGLKSCFFLHTVSCRYTTAGYSFIS